MSEVKNGRYVSEDGAIEWYRDGKLHREDGPAIEWFTGGKVWYQNGLRHREDGPAIEYHDGEKQWYLNGNEISEDEFNQWLAKKHLNERLHSTLAPSPPIKRSKI